MSKKIKKRHIYLDHKDMGIGLKAKVAGRPLIKLDIYGFFEVTSGRYVSDYKRVDIERHHLEKISHRLLRKPDGCVKIDPEIMTLAEIQAKQDDTSNGFKEIGRLCVEKWEELQQKVQSPRLRSGSRPWDPDKQSLIIELTQTVPDVEPTLQRLKLL